MEKNLSFGEQVIAYNKQLHYKSELPESFAVINPFQQQEETLMVMERFYRKFYADHCHRKFIIGIKPNRHGAGVTGVPFTDTKRLKEVCGIEMKTAYSHEVSSVFIYELIAQYGGAASFFSDFYINSPFPLAIIRRNERDKWVNANYYDNKALFNCVKSFMVTTLKKQLTMEIISDRVYVLGKKNADFIKQINKEEKLFGEIVVLEHPRFIMQYKSKQKDAFITKYLEAFSS
ncbi:SMUG2 DNA glycosylase family protein [Olivibacter ginsenosidimutans]